MSGRAPAGVASNPVFVGAVTVLATLVAMFLSYNANDGLPFVPTYEIDAVVPDAARLVPGNEVRIGGRRVGTVSAIEPDRRPDGTFASRLHLKLDQTAGPLPADTGVTVRPRSTLGLKYLELEPGDGRPLVAGGTLPEGNAREVVELDEALNAFDAAARRDLRTVVEEGSGAVAGRGSDVNLAVQALRPLLRDLEPVARTLADPDTDLRGFVDGVAAAATAFEPEAARLGTLVDATATTLAAVAAEREALGDVLDVAPVVEREATRTARVVRPVLAGAADLAEALRPGTRLLEPALRRTAAALETGTPVLRRATTLGPDLEATLAAAGRLARDPATAPSVRGVLELVTSLEPTLRYVTPFQTVCNYLGLWTRNVTSVISEGDANGTWFRVMPIMQPAEIFQAATPAPQLHVTPYGRLDGECEVGNERYVPGQLIGSTPEKEPFATEGTAPPAGVGRP